MEIKVKVKETGAYQTLILDNENFTELAEAIRQYIIANRPKLRPPEMK